MINLIADAKRQISEIVMTAYRDSVGKGTLPDAEPSEGAVEIPKDPSHGDYASGFCMSAAKALSMPPRKIAEALLPCVSLDGTFFSSVEAAGAGFLNFRLASRWYSAVLGTVRDEGPEYGSGDAGGRERVMVEFVSANPTGPMTIGNARGGVLGDSLASVLSKSGYDVWREFYVNDAGNQIDLFARSLEARILQEMLGEDAVAFPEDGYHGEDIRALAREFIETHGGAAALSGEVRREKLVVFGLRKNIARMHSDLERYGIRYDHWYLESELHKSGYVAETMELLKSRGATYEKDGALWFKASEYGCDKDEVLVKSNGFFTYFAVDVAYHRDKFEKRGFDRVIDIFGADHHGHTLRFKAGMAALGIDPSRLDFVLMQLVRLVKNGEVYKVSKRTGRAVTLGDLLDEIPVDAARFFFNSRQSDTHLEFDMDLAIREDSENPVYYVQYAHARICSLLARLETDDSAVPGDISDDIGALLSSPSERELIKALAAYPEEIRLAARSYEPARINKYLVELSARFHAFYNACRIKGESPALLQARLDLAAAVRDVLRNGLGVIGVHAPEKM